MDKITLSIEVNGNVTAMFSGDGELTKRVLNLFTGGMVQTPFTFDRIPRGDETEHHAAFIIRKIRELNPSAVVEWHKDRCEQLLAFRWLQQTLKETKPQHAKR